MTETNETALGASDRRRRLGGPQKLSFNGKSNETIPYASNNPAVVDAAGVWVVDKSRLYPDDLLKTALDCCNSVRDPSPYVETLGNALLLAMDARALKRHGYEASPAERDYRVDYTGMLGGRNGFLLEMEEFYDEIAGLHESLRESRKKARRETPAAPLPGDE